MASPSPTTGCEFALTLAHDWVRVCAPSLTHNRVRVLVYLVSPTPCNHEQGSVCRPTSPRGALRHTPQSIYRIRIVFSVVIMYNYSGVYYVNIKVDN